MQTREVQVHGAFDLHRTVRTLGVGTIDDDGAWWWAATTPDGSATIAVSGSSGGVVGRAWGDGSDAMLDRLPRLVGATDDYSVTSGDKRVKDIFAATRGLRLGSTGDVHEAIVKAVIGQVVTGSEGHRSLRSLIRAFGADAPGPKQSLGVFPAAEVLAGLNYEEFHVHGIEARRAATIIEVSRRSKRLEEILTMDPSAAETRLLAVRGVGQWTAGIVMGQAYGDRDAIPLGDYHLPNLVAWALAGEPRGDDARMVELLEPYRPYRRHVLFAIKQSGIKAPKYGPRTALRTHL
jgi:3-methyladenine DNA glycosylase/8-oxoguanine DNA glycosylase